MKKEYRILYGVMMSMVIAILTVGATYAYLTASTQSSNNALYTKSTIFSISMNITPLYNHNEFSIIPLNDSDALKALDKKCKDKYDRGACSAYTIYVYDYNEDLDYISGFMNVTTNNMTNLSYMMLRLSDTYDESSCVLIGTESYCVVKEASAVVVGEDVSLGDSYDVFGMKDTKFILMIWLSNLPVSQNDFDIGDFSATVTIQAGSGGEIKGTISNAIKIPDPDTPSVDDTTGGEVDNSGQDTSDEVVTGGENSEG